MIKELKQRIEHLREQNLFLIRMIKDNLRKKRHEK